MATIVPVKTKSGTKYQAIIRIKGHRPIKKTWSTKGQARAWAAEQEKLIQMKQYQDPRLADLVTLKTALDKYADHSKDVLKKAQSTLAREQSSYKHLIRILGKETPLSEISTNLINDYQLTRIKEKTSQSSIRQELSILSRMFRTARSTWQLPVLNPVENIERVPPPKGRERFLNEAEINILIKESKKVPNKKFYAFVLLLLNTGMRPGEAAKLQLEHLDFKNNTVEIHETKTKVPRTLPLNSEVSKELQKLKPDYLDYLFLKESHLRATHTALNPSTIFRRSWEKVWRKMKDHFLNKFQPFTPHDIRHTAASHLLAMGTDIRIIADILGHKSLTMVMRYTHIAEKTKREHLNKLSLLTNQEE